MPLSNISVNVKTGVSPQKKDEKMPNSTVPATINVKQKMCNWNKNKERILAVFTNVDSTWSMSLEWVTERLNLLYWSVPSGQAEIQTSC